MSRSDTLLGTEGVCEEEARAQSGHLGFGPLSSFVDDPRATDVLANGDGRIWVDRGRGLEDTGQRVPADGLRPLAVRLAAMGGRRLDDAQPWVDAVLPNQIRLHAILPPLVRGEAHVSLRVPRVSPTSLHQMVAIGLVDRVSAPVVGRLVERGLSFLVCGGTGSGKTTLLGGLLGLVPDGERIVVVEDVSELRAAHGHVVHLQGRSPNVEGQGGVSMADLVRQALRMRPDRVVVGEVRGAEVRELLGALNTGHAGAGTVHANGVREIPARLRALGSLAGLPQESVDLQLTCGLHVAVGMARHGQVRRVTEIGVVSLSNGRADVSPALTLDRSTWARGPGLAGLQSLLDRDLTPDVDVA